MSGISLPADGQCAFFLEKKKRFCRFRPNQGQKYCAEHACVLGVELDRKRILCPLNPKHTCYADNLDKHLKKCNSRKKTSEEYYEEGINTGTDDGDVASDTQFQTAVKDTDTNRIRKMIEKVNQLYEEYIGTIVTDIQSHKCLQEELNNPSYGLPALRHRRQQASLIGQLGNLGLLSPGYCYVEMGAGKGQLSHWIRQAVTCHNDAAFLLIDRSSIRYKVDGYHKEEEKVKFERIKIDIENLNLGKVPMVANSEKPLVAVGKHLCGAATDLTLRCLLETVGSKNTESSSLEPSMKRRRTDSVNRGRECSETCPASPSAVHEKKCRDLNSNSFAGGSGESSLHDETSASLLDTVQSTGGLNEEDTPNNQCEIDRFSAKAKTLDESQDCKHASDDRRVHGVVIALCCHHQCKWKAYVGKKFMQQNGITAADFSLLTRLTSWAVCGWQDNDNSFGTKEKLKQEIKLDSSANQREKQDTSMEDSINGEEVAHSTEDLVSNTSQISSLQLSEKQKETLGWRCKRLIDYGRVCYLQDRGLSAELKIYVDAQQTPENVVLIATPSNKG